MGRRKDNVKAREEERREHECKTKEERNHGRKM